MTRKRTKRRVWSLINPIDHAIKGARLIPEGTQDRVRIRELSAIEAFDKGYATVTEFQLMIDMCNLAEQLAREGVGPEVLQAVHTHEAALQAIARRRDENGGYTASKEDVAAFRDLHAYHDLQRQCVSQSAYEQAFDKAKRRILSRAPGVIEL